MARRKHQLSSLLAAAHDNRAELEERIAQARASRKGAGSKYGASLSSLSRSRSRSGGTDSKRALAGF